MSFPSWHNGRDNIIVQLFAVRYRKTDYNSLGLPNEKHDNFNFVAFVVVVKPLCDGCKTHWQRNANRLRGLFQRLENNKTFVPGPDALKKIFGIKLPLQHSFSPGLVVMWGDSCSEGCEFKSQHHILDGHFSHLFLVRIVMFVWKDKNKWKRGPF